MPILQRVKIMPFLVWNVTLRALLFTRPAHIYKAFTAGMTLSECLTDNRL